MSATSDIERVKSVAADASAVIVALEFPAAVNAVHHRTVADVVSQADSSISAVNSVVERRAATEFGVAELETQAIEFFNTKLTSLDEQLAKVRLLRPTPETQDALVNIEGRLQAVRRDVRRLAVANIAVGSRLPELKDRPLSECILIAKVLASFEGTLRDSKKWWPGWRDFTFRLAVGVLGGLILLGVRTAIDNSSSATPPQPAGQKAITVAPPHRP